MSVSKLISLYYTTPFIFLSFTIARSYCLLCSVRGTIERYKKASAASTNTESVSEANTQVNGENALWLLGERV